MARFVGYYDRFRGMRSDLTGLPSWARMVFVLIVLPGIALVALSIVAFIVSVAALFALALPAYSLLRAITRGARTGQQAAAMPQTWNRAQARHVDVTVRNAPSPVPDEINGE